MKALIFIVLLFTIFTTINAQSAFVVGHVIPNCNFAGCPPKPIYEDYKNCTIYLDDSFNIVAYTTINPFNNWQMEVPQPNILLNYHLNFNCPKSDVLMLHDPLDFQLVPGLTRFITTKVYLPQL